MDKVGLGGSCHWCTEAIFQSLVGVVKVEQGFIAPKDDNDAFSEAIIVYYNPKEIELKDLIEIHLYTHKSTSEHSMRDKYRSAVYGFDNKTMLASNTLLNLLQEDFDQQLITKTVRFGAFKFSDNRFHDYYYSNPKKPFCETYIAAKLQVLLNKFSKHLILDKINSSHE